MKEQIDDQVNVKAIKDGVFSAGTVTSRKMRELDNKAALISSRAQVAFLKASGRSREMIHRRPLTSVLAGAGTGCLVGGLAGLIVGRYTKRKSSLVGCNIKETKQGQTL